MHDTGLRWGDGDAFNITSSSAAGDGDATFGVTTRTEPGYFIPKETMIGTSYEDLRFDFRLPTVSDPERTLDTMLEAAHRAQERLGGTLAFGNGEPLDEKDLREEVHGLTEEMRGLGWLPGAPRTKELF